MAIYEKNTTGVTAEVARGARLKVLAPKSGAAVTNLVGVGGIFNRKGFAVTAQVAAGSDASTFNRAGKATVAALAAQGPNVETLVEKGAAVSSARWVSSPAPPQPPEGLLSVAVGQPTMFQDPVWTTVWPS